MDEATNLANNRKWNSDVNTYFGQFLDMFRSFGLILILCIPERRRLDNYLREGHRTKYFIECVELHGHKWYGRGYYHLTINGAYENYVCMGTFPKMDTSVIDRYKELKKASQRDKLEEMINILDTDKKKANSTLEKNNAHNKQMVKWFAEREGWSYREISEQFDIPLGTIKRWMHELKDSE